MINNRIQLRKIFVILLASAALLLFSGAIALRVSAESMPADLNIQKENLSVMPEAAEDGGYYLRTKAISVSLAGEDYEIYTASTQETTASGWHTNIVWTRGKRLVFSADGNWSAAFRAVRIASGSEAPGECSFADFTASPVFAECGNIFTSNSMNNFTVDTVVPEIKLGEDALPQNCEEYYLDQTFTLVGDDIILFRAERLPLPEDATAVAAQVMLETVPLVECLAQDPNGVLAQILQDGFTLYAKSNLYEEIRLTVADRAGNTVTRTLKLGVPQPQDILGLYTEEWNPANPESKTAAMMAELGPMPSDAAARERWNRFGEAIRSVETAYREMAGAVDGFRSKTLSLVDFSRERIAEHARALREIDGIYSSFTAEQRNAVNEDYHLLEKCKEQFRTVRFTDGSTALSVPLAALADNASTYTYYLSVQMKQDDIKEYGKSVHVKDAKLNRVYLLRLIDAADGSDVSGTLGGKTLSLRISFGTELQPKDAIAGIFSENGYRVVDFTSGTETLSITLTDGLATLGILTTKYTHPFLLYGLPVIGIVLLAAGVAIAVIFALKKSSKNPDAKLTELESKLEQQKRVNEIARKSKEEELRVNLELAEENERRRKEAIEKVKEERRKSLEEKERELRERAERDQTALAKAQLAEFERMAAERAENEKSRTQEAATRGDAALTEPNTDNASEKKSAKAKAKPKASSAKNKTKNSSKKKG